MKKVPNPEEGGFATLQDRELNNEQIREQVSTTPNPKEKMVVNRKSFPKVPKLMGTFFVKKLIISMLMGPRVEKVGTFLYLISNQEISLPVGQTGNYE